MKILEHGIYLIILCLPLYLVRFSVFGLPSNVLEVLIGLLFIIWLIKMLKGNQGAFKRNNNLLLIIPIILILVGVTIATVFSWDLRMSAGIWKGWFIIPLVFFIILITTIKKPEQIRNIFYSLIASGFIVSIISLIYLIQGNLDIHGRLQGIYNSPNYLAMYLAPILIISLIVFLINNLRPIWLIINCLLLIIVLFFTKSFGAWLGILAAVLFGLLLYVFKFKNKKLIWLIVVLSLIIFLFLGYFKLFISNEGGKSYDARIVIWQRAWEAFKMNPGTGIGPGTFEYYFPPYPKWGVPQPHNLYLAFLLQTGIIGFIGFVWLLVWFFKKGFELFKTRNLLAIIIMSVMVYILTHGLVDTTYWKNDLAVMFWVIVALLSIAIH